jgi:hypothetical protein
VKSVIPNLKSSLLRASAPPRGNVFIFCLFFLCCSKPNQNLLAAAPVLPDYPISAPDPAPQWPDGFQPFTPPVSAAAPSPDAPAIAAWNASAGPDQSFVLTGDLKQAKFLIFGQTTQSNGTLASATIQNATDDGVILTVPAAEPAGSLYLVWPQTSAGTGPPIALNRPRLVWLSDATANPGQLIQAYGRNLTGAGRSWVFIQSSAGTGQWISASSANPYRIEFILPASLPTGMYRIWINNGLAKAYSFSDPLPLEIQPARVVTASRLSVRDYGALANGATDDGPAIQSALRACHPGDTLFFPAGSYSIGNEQIDIPSNIRLSGDGPQRTQLLFKASLAGPMPAGPYCIGFPDGPSHDIQIDSLALHYVGSGKSGALVRQRSGANFTFRDVRLISGPLAPIDWSNSSRFRLERCQIDGSGLILNNTHDAVIDGCQFLMAFEPDAAINVFQGHNIAITHSTFADSNPSSTTPAGWGKGRLLENGLSGGSNFNEYFADNTSINLGGLEADNCGEQICCEGARDCFIGTPLSATATTLSLPITVQPQDNMVVIVTGGRGLGQLRRVVSYGTLNGALVLILDRPWTVLPDDFSRIDFCWTIYDSVFYHNTFADDPGPHGPRLLQAAAGIELWNGGYGLVMDGNTTNHLNSGLLLTSDIIDNPCYFIDVLNNRLANSIREGIAIQPLATEQFHNYLGVVARGNRIETSANTGINLIRSHLGPVYLSAFEHNTILNAPIGFRLNKDRSVLLYRNNLDAGSAAGPGTSAFWFASSSDAVCAAGNTVRHFSHITLTPP